MRAPTGKLLWLRLVRAAVLSAAVCSALPALAADFRFTPVLSLSEEFNDNMLNTAHDRQSDFITRLQPGAAALYRGPSLNGELSYNFDYQNYARGTREDEKNHFLALRGSAELVDNFLFLEASDTLSRVSLKVTRDVTSESAFANQTDQNRGSFSPYLLWRLGSKSTLKTGYRFTDTSYWGSPGIDKREHRGFADLSHEPLARLQLSAGYAFGRAATDLVDYDQHDLSSGFRYEYAEKSHLYAGIGNSWQSFSDTRSASNLFWHAGISRDVGFAVGTLETRAQYAEDPLTVSTKETSYSARLERALQHGALGISSSYSKYLDTRGGAGVRRKAVVGGFARYEMTPRLNASLALTGDKVSRETVDDYAYRLNGTAGLDYGFNYDISASLNYSYIVYRRDWESAADAKETNRVVFAVRKAF